MRISEEVILSLLAQGESVDSCGLPAIDPGDISAHIPYSIIADDLLDSVDVLDPPKKADLTQLS